MSKWIAEFDLEDGDKMPEHMEVNFKGAKIDFYCRPKEPILDKTREEAIKEVKNYDNYPNGISKECRNYIIKVLEQEPCDDAVSRKAVITIIQNHWWNCRDIDKLVNELPSVTPQEPRWIPVSECLPEEKVNPITMDFYEYPCTVKFGDVYDVRYYKFGRGKWWHGAGTIDKEVIAWQPLPESYKESEEV